MLCLWVRARIEGAEGAWHRAAARLRAIARQPPPAGMTVEEGAMLPWRVVDQLLHPRHRRRLVSNGQVVETLWCARAAVENATCALDAARLAAAYGGDTDTAAAIAAGVWCAAGGEVDPAAWALPHLGAPVPRWFREAAKPVLVPAVPWERGDEPGRVLQ